MLFPVVGAEYENSAGRYRVLEVSGDMVSLLYLSGDVAGLVGHLPIQRLCHDWDAVQARRKHPFYPRYRDIIPFPGLYHLTHIDNLSSILLNGILCKNRLSGRAYVDISDQGVQNLRDKLSIILRCPSGLQRRRGVHDFVPLFFNPIVPMLYACKAWSLRIVAIEITPDILENPLVLFSDGNVSMQQMRSRPGWHTDIYVSCDGSPCRRRHRQDGWDKTGSSRPASNIYHGLEHLECLRWDIITATSWAGRFGTPADPDARRLRSAEVLVPREVSVAAFRRIVVGNPRARFEAAAEVHAVGMDIPVEIDPRFRWPNWSSVLETDGEQFYGSELPRR